MTIVINGTTGISGVDGSAGTPSYVGGDSDTGLWYPAANTLALSTGGSERLRIDSSGNVGIGTSSPATIFNIGGSSDKSMRVDSSTSNASFFGIYQDSAAFGVNRNPSSGAFTNTGKAASTIFCVGANADGYISFNTASANNTSPTERMRIDSSGNVGIGASTVTALGASITTLQLRGKDVSNGGGIRLDTSDASHVGYLYIANSGIALGTATSTPSLFYTANAERMRITSDGNLLVGTTTVDGVQGLSIKPNASEGSAVIIFNKSTSTVSYPIEFRYNGTAKGYISYNDTSTTYSTSSDYRLKENISPMIGALAKVAQLKPCTYIWKETGNFSQGFIAHELQAVVPDCVTGEKDAVDEDGKPVYQGVDTSFLVATLTAAIQEQQAMIEELKAEVALLKANH